MKNKKSSTRHCLGTGLDQDLIGSAQVKKFKSFIFGSAGCSLSGAEGFSYGLKALPVGTVRHKQSHIPIHRYRTGLA
jgi:hypothetical protein